MSNIPTRTKALITGIAGFCGSYLAEFLLERGLDVVGIELDGVDMTHLRAIQHQIQVYHADIRDSRQIMQIMAEARPDQIYHLAALTKLPPQSTYRMFYEVNLFGTINLLEAVRKNDLRCKVLIAGSSSQYGLVLPEENPITETHPFRPITDYAISKVTQDLAGYRYGAGFNVPIIRTRAFNIIGPRQNTGFVASAFARQIAEIEHGLKSPRLEVGNLTAERDFVDVRDVVRAYWLALAQGLPGETYNVSSGQARSIDSLLQALLAFSTVPNIDVQPDPARIQPADIPTQTGSFAKLYRQTGWEPEISFKQSVYDLLAYWRKSLEQGD